MVNGRTPNKWFIHRYQIKQDKRSGLLNDPNGWFEHPQDLISAIREAVAQVSVETVRIVADLTEPMPSGPDVFGGKPIIRDMRVSVELVLSLLTQGVTAEAIVEDYPGLDLDDIRACTAYAREANANDTLPTVTVTDS